MIEQEVLEILADSADDGLQLNLMADEFRSGRDVNELMSLIDSEDASLVSIGSWILGEIPHSLYASEAFLARLLDLTDHEDSAVRFHAFGAIYPFLEEHKARAREIIEKLRSDPNKGVRMSAEAALDGLGLTLSGRGCDAV